MIAESFLISSGVGRGLVRRWGGPGSDEDNILHRPQFPHL